MILGRTGNRELEASPARRFTVETAEQSLAADSEDAAAEGRRSVNGNDKKHV